MTKTTLERATLLFELLHHTSGRTFDPLRMISCAMDPPHGGSSMKSGVEPGTLRPRSRDLITRTPGPVTYIIIITGAGVFKNAVRLIN
ncbi:hypothetical protein AVEN_240258-1 [Araneus ventricosus]|uniref:Uncharacterized protein n=1 Tax=Araneus ventricosus TaxID=182803 RepID=A0A4Y2WSS5_ARAVE|nr:hypothetical protein AVEN_240258-1 [Araneus ventricosus]